VASDRVAQMRAFRRGWLAGVELATSGVERRNQTPDELEHWRRGRDQGFSAANAALWAYEQKLKAEAELLGEGVSNA
jgi:hypothetical protein